MSFTVLPKQKKKAQTLRLFSVNVTYRLTSCLFTMLPCVCSREVLQEVLDTDLSNEAFPFSTHKVVNAAGHQVRKGYSR